jgi:hypoxanthine phosphoribosyltransferase
MRVLVLLSGGRDSVCLLHTLRDEDVSALHVNYGLRGEESDADEAFCRALCAQLGIELTVVRAGTPVGNVQAWAREVRYAEAAKLAGDGAIAVGHTATDQLETLIYRLAASPGRRALLGMREDRVIRPLLEMTREETAAYCRAHGLAWREDSSNATSARGLIRDTILPALRQLHPAAEQNMRATLELLREEAAALDDVVAAALAGEARASGEARGGGGARTGGEAQPGGAGVALAGLSPAIARLVAQRLADESAGGRAPALTAHADAILALANHPGTTSLDLPGGLRASSEYGRVRIERAPATEPPTTAELPIPGRVAFGDGELVSERGSFAIADGTLAAAALAPTLEVRAWRPGDRMRPLGLGGSKSLQDLFTDRKVPREARHRLPVVVSDGEIAWVPGVATGERFRVAPDTRARVKLQWLQGPPRGTPVRPDAVHPRRLAPPSSSTGGSPPAPAGDARHPRWTTPDGPGLPRGTPRLRGPMSEEIGEILVQADDLQHRIRAMAEDIARDYEGKDLLLIGVLKGAFLFLADLMRHLDVGCEVDFMAVASYGSSTESSGVVRILKDLDAPLEGRHVLIVEDIVDSGLTLQYLMRTLEGRNPASLEVCALLTKPSRRTVDLPVRYTGFEIPDKFAIGYGLDYAERYRNLPYVAALVLTDD